MPSELPPEAPAPAPKLLRLAAHAIDTGSVFVLIWVLNHLLGEKAGPLLLLLPAVLGVPLTMTGSTLGQRACGLTLVCWRTKGRPPRIKVWQWVLTKQLLSLLGFAGVGVGALFYIPILTDKHQRSLYDDWADVFVVRRSSESGAA
jgi:hypothetical protein